MMKAKTIISLIDNMLSGVTACRIEVCSDRKIFNRAVKLTQPLTHISDITRNTVAHQKPREIRPIVVVIVTFAQNIVVIPAAIHYCRNRRVLQIFDLVLGTCGTVSRATIKQHVMTFKADFVYRREQTIIVHSIWR